MSRRDLGFDPMSFDVRTLVQRSVASLYAHLVTRPTGRAVRLAIEGQIGNGAGRTLSVIDLSEVTILDFSCADEVVAKLLLRFRPVQEDREAFFVLRGLGSPHREPIGAVLERHDLAVVAQTTEGDFELLGSCSDEEVQAWSRLERTGVLGPEQLDGEALEPGEREALDRLASRHLVFRREDRGEFLALSSLVRDLLD